MGAAGQRFEPEGGSGDGTFDVRPRAADGTDFIIELKRVPRKHPKTGKNLTQSALRKKLSRPYRRPSNRQKTKSTRFNFRETRIRYSKPLWSSADTTR
jgi:hypothetical protein